jgi:hypothetical protein
MFHFTNKEGLFGILKSEFNPRYCKERMTYSNNINWDYWLPVVCFCDIPLHLVGEHINIYGKYAIGLNRSWAILSKLNPVLYYDKESLLYQIWDELISDIHKENTILMGAGLQIKSMLDNYSKCRYLFQYFKPYSGYDFKTDSERVFYNEREWRYTPIDNNDIESIISDSNFDLNKKDEYNNKYINKKLSFDPKDISYIVLKNESERYDAIQEIRSIKGKYSNEVVQTLISKIITAEQIENDF